MTANWTMRCHGLGAELDFAGRACSTVWSKSGERLNLVMAMVAAPASLAGELGGGGVSMVEPALT
ncbi:hypothetical protein N8D56_27230 (plasmid) [Devosia sp. A8/3-2]|nr:hypothetical protein N8D56_27230 [Devosia sp. A8/3-2]